jgi:hypothetical protein
MKPAGPTNATSRSARLLLMSAAVHSWPCTERARAVPRPARRSLPNGATGCDACRMDGAYKRPPLLGPCRHHLHH